MPPAHPHSSSRPSPDAAHGFACTEEAWFWTMASLAARRARLPAPTPGPARPCAPEDVLRCLDGLYRRRRVELLHARILRIWGERGVAPNPAWPGERCDWRLWREAMDRLDWPLRLKGIVTGQRATAAILALRREGDEG